MARSIFILFCVIVLCLSTISVISINNNIELSNQIEKDKLIIDSLNMELDART